MTNWVAVAFVTVALPVCALAVFVLLCAHAEAGGGRGE